VSPRLRLMTAWILVVVVGGVALIAGAVAEAPPATDADRAYGIKETTLCPVCDGQNVLESNAAVAAAIRLQIDELVAAGQSSDDIRVALAQSYGEDVNANPPRSGFAGLVWVIPVVAIAAAAMALGLAFSRWRSSDAHVPTPEDRRLVDEELARRSVLPDKSNDPTSQL
jgi:cytochrome c-type biogenesis protein CcmH/NrfF